MTISKHLFKDHLLLEASWEVCNQMGGIYTVIRSKLPATVEKWGDNYCLIGPLVNDAIDVEFEEITEQDSSLGKAVAQMRDMGFELKFGTWLVSGRPKAVLINPDNSFNRIDAIKRNLYEQFGVPVGTDDELYDISLQWCDTVYNFLTLLSKTESQRELIVHGHEWMTCATLLQLKQNGIKAKTVFTTH